MGSFVNLTNGAGSDTDGNSTATTGSITLPANTLVYILITSRNASVDPSHPTITGWSEAGSVNYDNSGSQKRLTALSRVVTTDTTGTLSIAFGGQNQTDIAWTAIAFPGIDISGTNGSGALAQTPVTATDTSGAGTSLSATLSAFSNTANATFAAIAVGNVGVTVTPGSGFTKTTGAQASANGVYVVGEFRSDNDTSVDFTTSPNGELGLIAFELKAGPPVGKILSVRQAINRASTY